MGIWCEVKCGQWDDEGGYILYFTRTRTDEFMIIYKLSTFYECTSFSPKICAWNKDGVLEATFCTQFNFLCKCKGQNFHLKQSLLVTRHGKEMIEKKQNCLCNVWANQVLLLVVEIEDGSASMACLLYSFAFSCNDI